MTDIGTRLTANALMDIIFLLFGILYQMTSNKTGILLEYSI